MKLGGYHCYIIKLHWPLAWLHSTFVWWSQQCIFLSPWRRKSIPLKNSSEYCNHGNGGHVTSDRVLQVTCGIYCIHTYKQYRHFLYRRSERDLILHYEFMACINSYCSDSHKINAYTHKYVHSTNITASTSILDTMRDWMNSLQLYGTCTTKQVYILVMYNKDWCSLEPRPLPAPIL